MNRWWLSFNIKAACEYVLCGVYYCKQILTEGEKLMRPSIKQNNYMITVSFFLHVQYMFTELLLGINRPLNCLIYTNKLYTTLLFEIWVRYFFFDKHFLKKKILNKKCVSIVGLVLPNGGLRLKLRQPIKYKWIFVEINDLTHCR